MIHTSTSNALNASIKRVSEANLKKILRIMLTNVDFTFIVCICYKNITKRMERNAGE